jgi:glycosyltransferase involved in cell wall biosynthesis
VSDAVKVLVDATILKPNLGGIRTYTRTVLAQLAKVPVLDLHVATSAPSDVPDTGTHVHRVPAATRSFLARAAWRETTLRRLTIETGSDLVFVPCPELPLRRLPVPTVMMVYDVGPLVAPAYFTRAKRLRFAADLGRACRAATTVVCVSNATLISLHAATAVDPRKCVVIGGGPSAPREASLPGCRDGRPYVLYVGTLLMHKNVPTLVRALAEEPAGWFDLVLAGPRTDAERAAFERLVDQLGVGDRVRHVGWVDEGTLARLYAGALAVALPSLHEGYGLPALEAMGYGVPVVASDIPVIREVGDDAVLYVREPLDPASWRRRLDSLRAADARRALGERGRQQASTHTWEAAAEAFVALFRELAQN